MYVCFYGFTKMINVLISPKSGRGDNINLQNNNGYTALMCACKYNNTVQKNLTKFNKI